MNSFVRAMLPVLALLMVSVAPKQAAAQAPGPRNELGIAFNHVSVLAPAVLFEQESEFWQKRGGERRQPGAARFVVLAFPDLTVTVRDVEATGGTVGSVIDRPTGLQPDGRTGIAYVLDPWGVRIELFDRNAGPGR